MTGDNYFYWFYIACLGVFLTWSLHKLLKGFLNDTNRIARKNHRNTRSLKIPQGGTVTYDTQDESLSIAGGTLSGLQLHDMVITKSVTVSGSQISGGVILSPGSILGSTPNPRQLTLAAYSGVVGPNSSIKFNTSNRFSADYTDYTSLPREKAELPLVAWKNASIRYIKGLYLFQPLNTDFPRYDTEEDALCGHDSFHKEKDAFFSCTCGFYALAKKPATPAYTAAKPPLCTLTVELSGLVLVCEQGYRATHQKVLKAEFENECARLEEHGAGVALPPTGFGFGEDDCLRPYCDAHRDEQRNSLSAEDLEQILEIEVVFRNETV